MRASVRRLRYNRELRRTFRRESREHRASIAVTDPVPGSFLPLIEPPASGSGTWVMHTPTRPVSVI
jgi:hypothetical protein